VTKGKNYNSIVFLTTLSVYLGLVLVGGAGAPQVLAQAALTRNFDIQIEAEFKDDLDNKPDNESCTEPSAKADAQDNQFIGQYAKFVSELVKINYSPDYEMSATMYSLSVADAEIFDQLFPSLRKTVEIDEFDYELKRDNFTGKIILKPKSSVKNVSFPVSDYSAILNYQLCRSLDKFEPVVLKHTEVFHENNQIFIVTRLPRGSIDTLLAKNAQQ
jgi:hypothetical protein